VLSIISLHMQIIFNIISNVLLGGENEYKLVLYRAIGVKSTNLKQLLQNTNCLRDLCEVILSETLLFHILL